MDPVFNNLSEHITIFLAGSTAMSLIAHAVNTFPVPTSQFGKWLLGLIQFAVGQRLEATQTRNGAGSNGQKENGT